MRGLRRPGRGEGAPLAPDAAQLLLLRLPVPPHELQVRCTPPRRRRRRNALRYVIPRSDGMPPHQAGCQLQRVAASGCRGRGEMHAQPCSAGDDPRERPAQRDVAPERTDPPPNSNAHSRASRARRSTRVRSSLALDAPPGSSHGTASDRRSMVNAPLSQPKSGAARSTYDHPPLGAPRPRQSGCARRYGCKYQGGETIDPGSPPRGDRGTPPRKQERPADRFSLRLPRR